MASGSNQLFCYNTLSGQTYTQTDTDRQLDRQTDRIDNKSIPRALNYTDTAMHQ